MFDKYTEASSTPSTTTLGVWRDHRLKQLYNAVMSAFYAEPSMRRSRWGLH